MTLRGIGRVIVSYCVTGYQFGDDSFEIRLCRAFKRRLFYADLRYCVARISHSQLRVGPLRDEETYVHRVYLWTARGFGVALRVDDTESFIQSLRHRAPHVEIRRKPTLIHSITLAREEQQG